MREHFHVPDNYFLNHSVGCLPKGSVSSLEEQFFTPWAEGTNWQHWMPILDEFRHGVGRIIGVSGASICPQTNVSSALTKIISSLPTPKDRNLILLSEQDFPTIGFVVEQAKRQGYSVQFIKGDPTDIRHWQAAMTDKVAIVHVTHALSNTSHILPVKAICELAKRNGAISIIDAAQSMGVVPVRPKLWGADFVIGTGVKFMCFGPGACFLYVAPHMIERCAPIDVGWFSHENPFEMDIHDFRYAGDAMRFFGGTPSPTPFALGNAALKLWEGIGLEIVHKQIQTHLTKLVDSIAQGSLVSPRETAERGATLVVNPTDREAMSETLNNAGIKHDVRREGFRFSVHGYTSQEDVARLSEVLSKAL